MADPGHEERRSAPPRPPATLRLAGLGRLLGLDEADLWVELEGGEAATVDFGGWIMRMYRREPIFPTAWAQEEVDVELADGERIELLLKYRNPGERDAGLTAGIEGPPDSDPLREVAVYRRILAPRGIGPRFYGAAADAATGHFRLLVERLPGPALAHVRDIGTWEAVVRWLARFHLRLAGGEAGSLTAEAHLACHDRRFFLGWMDSVRTRSRAGAVPWGGDEPDPMREPLEALHRSYPSNVDRLLELPRTIVHGRLCPTTVMLRGTGGELEVVPTDWEGAGLGPPLVDLASLLAGSWSEEMMRRLAAVYRQEWIERGGEGWRDERAFHEAFDCCRLHSALQWLATTPFPDATGDPRQDRLLEALGLAARLGLVGGEREAAGRARRRTCGRAASGPWQRSPGP